VIFAITASKKKSFLGAMGNYRVMPTGLSISTHKSKKYDLFGWRDMAKTYPDGGFTKPCLRTGKTWEEIQQSNDALMM